ERSERRILEAIRRLREPEAQRVLLPEALAVTDAMRAHLDKATTRVSVEVAGELRRWAESIGELSLIVASERPADALKHHLHAPPLPQPTPNHNATFLARP